MSLALLEVPQGGRGFWTIRKRERRTSEGQIMYSVDAERKPLRDFLVSLYIK
jgi:hypothetical protein